MTGRTPLSPAPEVLEFLETRRSRSARTLGPTAPDRATLERLIACAARSPDHGKLAPWRFVVLGPAMRASLATAARAHGARRGMSEADAEKAAAQFGHGGAVVAVVSSPRPSAKIPVWEQELSAGAVCLALLNAALAAGWGANWLTGPFARDPDFLAQTLSFGDGEFVAGFLHIGEETVVPTERDRPDTAAITDWRD